MTQQFQPWPRSKPFPESMRETETGAGPDFPNSSGDRERGKFRPSRTPRLTTEAVSNDDGTPISRTTDERLDELILLGRATVLGLTLITGHDLLAEVEG